MKRLILLLAGILVTILIIYSCGEKIKMPTEVPPSGNLGDTLYLMLNPPWDAQRGYTFSKPTALYFGKDTYLYIADTDNNRIVQSDAAGTIRAIIPINHPISVSQDELMRLLVVTGEKRVYKIDMGPGGDQTPVIAFDYYSTAYPDTHAIFYKHRTMINENDRFTSITDIPANDKSYFVAVSSSLDSVNNGRIMWFWGSSERTQYTDSLYDSKFTNAVLDSFTNPIVITGNGITTTTHPNSIYAYDLSGTTHMIVCQDTGSYPVHDMKFERQPWDQHWVFNFTHAPGQDIIKNGVFDHPRAATADLQGNIYVVDSGPNRTCGVFKFSRNGVLLNTFCEPDSTDRFNSPSGISYDIYGDRRTVYVADTDSNRVLRFKLSTDIEH